MRRAVGLLGIFIFLAGCAAPSAHNEIADLEPGAFGPPLKKFCVVGPGFENAPCVQAHRSHPVMESGEEK